MHQASLINFFDRKLKEKDFFPIAKLQTRFPENHVLKTVSLVAEKPLDRLSSNFNQICKTLKSSPWRSAFFFFFNFINDFL